MLPFNEDLVEAHNMSNIGKTLGIKAGEDLEVEEVDTEAEVKKVWSMGRSMGFKVEAEDDLFLTKALLKITRRNKIRMEGSKQKRKDGIYNHTKV